MPVFRTLATRLLRFQSSTRNTEHVGPLAAPRVEMGRPSVETTTLLIHAPPMSTCILVPENEKSGQESGRPRTSPIVGRVVFTLTAGSIRVSHRSAPARAAVGCGRPDASLERLADCARMQWPGGRSALSHAASR